MPLLQAPFRPKTQNGATDMTDFDIDYASGRRPLERLLESVDRPGDYCVHGRLTVPMPRLEVDAVGLLSFPVPETQILALIGVADRAPYGRGEETLLDTSVRNCLQIDSSRIRLDGAAWDKTFCRLMHAAADGLGCPRERLDARLYKLLIYETGGFFTEHRDTEKVDGMVATLSVSLPVSGAGGELVVRHGDRAATIDMSAVEPSELAYAAFYADCAHETRPVTEGFRLSLVFNVFMRPEDSKTYRRAPDYTDLVEPVAKELTAWGEDGPDKLVWLLEHDYSEAGLSFDTLKNTDAAVGGVLKRAAKRADCALHAAIVHISETGTASYADGTYYDGWDYRGGDHAEAVLGEVLDGQYWLDSWASADGGRPEFGEIVLEAGELLPAGALNGAAPDEQRVHEASGNAGVTVERAYRHAAIVIWPRQRTLDILTEANVARAVAWVGSCMARNVEDGCALLARLVGAWPETARRYRGLENDAQARSEALGLLADAGDPELASRFLREVMQTRFDGSENSRIPGALALLAPAAAAEWLAGLVRGRFSRRPGAVLELLLRVGATPGFGWRETLPESVRAAVTELPGALDLSPDQGVFAWTPGGQLDVPRRPVGAAAISDLFVLSWRCGLNEEAESAATAICARPGKATPERAVPASLKSLAEREERISGSAAYRSLWRTAVDALLKRSARHPEAPQDWVIPANLGCDCKHCRQLAAFCADPDARVGRFPLRKDLRQHLHGQIDGHRLDMSHVTERRGSPFTLVCTKNRASYERRLEEYAEDVEWMRTLMRIPPTGDAADDTVAMSLRCLEEAIAAPA
ncbi:MAG: 2OG-Fe(II) oxygenase [Gammaproteobacteria bacterium]|nr:2OG-Fe(II) oxygenase [Gammaproteobacteria bacterium]MYE28873.1 2OG-Fe(II) oxygenase [Gammaproteobacteria bacterium]MYI03190.1 2OG-Fe(II) oxygenase [Gammaproteobacteria bacterium]